MDSVRFSLQDLLLAVANFVLLLHGLSVVLVPSLVQSKSSAGLSLGTFLFSRLCGLFGDTAGRNLVHIAGFYAWGRICLYLSHAMQLDLTERSLLALLGMKAVCWAWFARSWPPIDPLDANLLESDRLSREKTSNVPPAIPYHVRRNKESEGA